MPKLPRITGKELIRALQKEGFEVARQKGSHVQVRKFVKDEKITFPVPIHTSKILKQGTLKGILRKAGISIDHLSNLLKR
ncbi:MAG: type II toxin-antitoxin system HicA family toxin [Candidatus Aminicenantes bacterium]|nr:type II toxin-antitoxin system HicA family toxin [Candidatus Aminicenantes bacterium]